MNKDSVLFKQVAAVIGEERAAIELDRVADEYIIWDCDLCGAFLWMPTPQGPDFWQQISKGGNPYEQ